MRRLTCILIFICLLFVNSGLAADGDRGSFTRIHLMFGYGLAYGAATGDIRGAFYASGFGGGTPSLFGGNVTYPIDRSNNWSWRAEALYQWSGHWRAGIGIRGLPAEDIVGKTRSLFVPGPREAAKGSFFYMVADYLVLPVDAGSPWELSAGAGLCYARVTVDGDLGSYFQDTVYVESEPWEITESTVGGLVRLNFDLYLQSSLSLQLRLAGYFVPSIDVPSRSFSAWELEAHRINFSSFETTLGVSLHL